MQNKFSKCFVWVSLSTSDLKFHFLHEDTSADHPTRISMSKYRISNLDFKTSG